MNDEQRGVALFQPQPCGTRPFFQLAALSFAHVAVLFMPTPPTNLDCPGWDPGLHADFWYEGLTEKAKVRFFYVCAVHPLGCDVQIT